MDDRFDLRLREMLNEAELHTSLMTGLLGRLDEFVQPFAASLTEPEQRAHAGEYVGGLRSRLERKTGEAIAYLHEQERQGMQKFIGHVPWDHRSLIRVLAEQVGRAIGEPDGVVVFDPSGFAKKGTTSVGVARQWCGRQGKVDNGQVGVYLGYVSRSDHALVDVRRYLPDDWTRDRDRCTAAGVPKTVRFQTRHEQAVEMLDEHGRGLPHRWVAGDDEIGRSSDFRRERRDRGEHYVLAVPSNTTIRDETAEPPAYSGRGRRPVVRFGRVDRWVAALPEGAWTTIAVRDGEKGPLTVDVVCRRVRARGGRKIGPEGTRFVTRERLTDKTFKHDYDLSFAPDGTSVAEFARVTKAGHEIEECFRQCKGQGGVGGRPGAELGGLASPPDVVADRVLVPDRGNPAGGETDAGPDRSPVAGHPCRSAGGGVEVQHPADHPMANHSLDATD